VEGTGREFTSCKVRESSRRAPERERETEGTGQERELAKRMVS
jgi:hypothetical protein